MKQVVCPYCRGTPEWVENKEVYGGKNYGKSYMMYLCRKCDARVGCHNNTKRPLGVLANKETREWRMKAHAVFDPLWKTGKMERDDAYKILQRHFNRQVHIAQSDIETCKQIITLIKVTQ
jgi:hypothetical protein